MLKILIFLVVLVNTLLAFTDVDNDGMMDSWETQYGLSSPSGDADKDGFTNLQEFIRQSDPTVADTWGNRLAKVGNIKKSFSIYGYKKYKNHNIYNSSNNSLYIDNNYVGSATDVEFKGDYVFSVTGGYNSYINLYDLNANDKNVTFHGVWDNYFRKIAIKDNLLVAIESANAAVATIFDISDINNPIKKATINLPDPYSSHSEYYNLIVRDDKLFIVGTTKKNDSAKSFFSIYDIKDLSNIKSLYSTIIDTYSSNYKIAINDKNVYITADSNIYRYDISNILDVKIAKSYTDGTISDIKISNSFLYVVSSYYIKVYNKSLSEISSYFLTSFQSRKEGYLDGKKLYIPLGENGVDIYDLSYISKDISNQPLNPIAFNNFEDMNGSKLVLFDYNGDTTKTNKYLDIYEFNQEDSSVTLKKYYLDGTLIKQKSGTYTLLYGGKAIGIDIDDDYFVLYSDANKLAKSHNGVSQYVEGTISTATSSQIVSQNSLKLYQIASLKTNLTSAQEVHVSGDYAYVRDNTEIKIVDIKDINNPKIISTIASGVGANSYQNFSKIVVANHLLYATGYSQVYTNNNWVYKQTLSIYDISTPANPTLQSKTDIEDGSSSYFSILVKNNLAYIAGEYAVNGSPKTYLKIFDISDSSTPTLKGSLKFAEGYSPSGGIAKIGNYLYIGTNGYTLIANISDITNPTYEEPWSSSSVRDIKLKGDIAYMLGDYGLSIYDISNPLAPQPLQSTNLSSYITSDMLLKDNLLFIGQGYYGFDIYDATTLKKIVTIDTDGSTYSIDAIGKDTIIIADGEKGIKIFDLKAYDKDFDGIPDQFDFYPDDTTRFFVDNNNDGKIDALNANTNPSDTIYNGYNFDDDNFSLLTTSQSTSDVNLFLNSSDTNISISLFDFTSLFNKTNAYTSYIFNFDNFDSTLVSQLYNLNLSGTNLINSTSKQNQVQMLSLSSTYNDKVTSDNSGVDKRWIGFTPTQTANYSFVITKQDGLSSLIKIDKTQNVKIVAKIYGSEKTLLGEQALDVQKFSTIKMPLEEGKQYYISFDLDNIKQFKYNIMVVKEYENYFDTITLDANGEATYTFVTPKSTTYQYVLNANKQLSSQLYLGTQIDIAHKLVAFDKKFVNNTIGLRANAYTIKLKGEANAQVIFVLGQSDKREEIEPNNTYQSATAIDINNYNYNNNAFNASLKSNEMDFYKIYANSSFSVTLNPNLKLSNEDIANYTFNMLVYNSSGDVVEKSFEYLESGAITYNFNVGKSGTFFLRFNSDYPQDFKYTLSTSGTNAPATTQSELAYAQKYNTYILGKGFNLAASTDTTNSTRSELIILAGDANEPSNSLYTGIQKLSINMYNRFLLRGLNHDDIYYLNATADKIDIDKDGIIDNVIDDNNPTKTSFYQTIKDRATSDIKGPLFIYMVDHGANGSFKIKNGDIVKATELKSAIDEFINTSSRKVVVMIEACKSGSFIPVLTENGTRDDILVVASSLAGKLSYIDRFGNVSFSKFLADSILAGASMKDSFDKAKTKLNAQGGVYALQTPQISSGASDALLNYRVGGDFATASMELGSINDYFGKDKSSFDISTMKKNINIFAKIDGSGGINKVWATVIPPNYQPPVIADDSFETPDMTPYTVELKYNNDTKKYEGVYDKLEAAYEGEYSITYYIEDSDGNIISKAIKINGINIDSTIAEQTNKPVFELSSSYIEINLNGSDTLSINSLGNYTYSLTNSDETIATVSLNGKTITLVGKDLGDTTLSVTATNKGYTTTKELNIHIKESDSVKKTTISYQKGWSLISSKTVNGIVPSKVPNISTSWKYLKGKWQVYAKSTQTMQTLSEAGLDKMNQIDAGEGGWIYTTSQGEITQIGTPYNILGADLSKKLTYGWNLIGTGNKLSIKNIYIKISSYGSTIKNIWTYRNNKWFLYTKNIFYLENTKENLDIGTLESIKAGEGFWIYIE